MAGCWQPHNLLTTCRDAPPAYATLLLWSCCLAPSAPCLTPSAPHLPFHSLAPLHPQGDGRHGRRPLARRGRTLSGLGPGGRAEGAGPRGGGQGPGGHLAPFWMSSPSAPVHSPHVLSEPLMRALCTRHLCSSGCCSMNTPPVHCQVSVVRSLSYCATARVRTPRRPLQGTRA
jgi:hypothetical protein